MGTSITQVSVYQQIPAAPSTLQKSGALVSQGATNTSPGTRTLLTQLSDLTPIINGAKAVTSITQTGGTATVTCTAAHGFTIGDTLEITIVGATPVAYDGTFLCTVTTSTAFTYAVPSGTASPATGTISYTLEDVAELNEMATTFFAQGSTQGTYVLELGPGNPTDGVAFLTAWIAANPGVFYSYLVPRTWDANAAFLSMLLDFNATTAKTYFHVTTTLATYQAYTAQMKCVLLTIEAPPYGVWPANALTAISYTSGVVTATTTTAHGVAVGQWFQISGVTPSGYNGWWQAQPGTTGNTLVWNVSASLGTESVLGTLVASYYTSTGIGANEFSAAAMFYVTLNYAPAPANMVPPLNLAYLSGVTPFPTQGNAALLVTLKNANVTVIGTGVSGGISNTLVSGGNTLDGNPFNYWYSVDYAQINVTLQCNAAAINGANNPVNPLYLNQPGIDAVQAVAVQVMAGMVTYGLALGQVTQTELDSTTFAQQLAQGAFAGNIVVNAIPFSTYYGLNPSQYAKGIYQGYTIVYTPLRGFSEIAFNIIVTGFVAAP